MNVLVILAHPTPNSFNHAIAETVVSTLEQLGHSGVFHDLYAEGFDPVLPSGEILTDDVDPVVTEHCEQLIDADGIVLIHPNWWGMPPAVLKGWVDKIREEMPETALNLTIHPGHNVQELILSGSLLSSKFND